MTSSSRSYMVARIVMALMLTGSLLAPTADAEGLCADPHDSEPTRTLDVGVSARDALYRAGDVVKFRVSVTRELDGIAMGPAEAAEVTLAVELDGRMVGTRGVTDENGNATLRVRLRRFMPEGSADVYGWAEKLIADLPCRSGYEYEFGRFLYTNFVEMAK